MTNFDPKKVMKTFSVDRIQGNVTESSPKDGVRIEPEQIKQGWANVVKAQERATKLIPNFPTMEFIIDDMPATSRLLLKDLLRGKSVACTKIQREDLLTNIEAVSEFIAKQTTVIIEQQKRARAAMRDEVIPVQSEHGEVFIARWKWELILGGANRGRHTLLVGPPGTAKTDLMRALGRETGKQFFHMEVSGFSDVSQLEVERVITSVNGAPQMDMRPTPLIDALEAVEAGQKVILGVDEIARVSDPSILNPLLLLLAQGEYHSVVSKKVYTVTPDNFVLFATANDAQGYNFSGNSRRGMDAALADRMRRVELTPPSADHIGQIIQARVQDVDSDMLDVLTHVYRFCEKDADLSRIMGVRAILGLADDWATLGGSDHWNVGEVLERTWAGDPKHVSAITTALAAMGF